MSWWRLLLPGLTDALDGTHWLQVANALLHLGPLAPPHEEGVVVPTSAAALRALGEQAIPRALENWFREKGLSYCTNKHSGVRCTAASAEGCILQRWAVSKADVDANMVRLEFALQNPVQPLRPARFLEVCVTTNTQMCRMVYGHLDRRPCPVSPEWLKRAKELVGVNFVVNDVVWLGYDAPPLPEPDVGEVTERDAFIVPGAELCFKFVYLPAVLDFFLPEVGHAKQCSCVTVPAYFRKCPRGTTVSYMPEVGMPYQFYDKKGDIRATFGVILRHKRDHSTAAGRSEAASVETEAEAMEMVPAYISRDCVGLFPHYAGVPQQCDACNEVMHVVSVKNSRAKTQRTEGTYIDMYGESIFIPKSTSPTILSAVLGPFGKVSQVEAVLPTQCTRSMKPTHFFAIIILHDPGSQAAHRGLTKTCRRQAKAGGGGKTAPQGEGGRGQAPGLPLRSHAPEAAGA